MAFLSQLPKPAQWSMILGDSPIPECLSSHYQVYLLRRKITLAYAAKVFGSRDFALHWFTKPARGLDYRPPCIVIANDDGYPQVNDYISRIEYGVYC